ncbi:Fur family transcriptional regulator [Fructilactobacillus fructivorans]|uniref:Fur family transcriptional regulator n=1 Tax=Fructilactobacillus fructivorans TaxID=1614 RepID=UPI00223B73DC|nr:Fur family transcriptional regulator [Fructilactobacillus fructivorans]MCT0151643.1 transcriptional repressor [Fructilactobacillus fructivorans]MCT2867228.1 transcriptional repressor [Fructilactobacillus fructivorans]MCT2868211.1 transcriptional repressor [Fructilactobacillus fructivorans]MCT2872919.1 transcriptional repressor [Fructilactobacillus fructivorans]
MNDREKKEAYGKAMDILKSNNVRITPQRQIILKYLIDHNNHPSVETIFHFLEETFPNLSMATVYNNLCLFKKLRIVIELPNPDGGYRYDFYSHPHFHAICDTCGKIIDIDDPKFKKIDEELQDATKKVGFDPSVSNVEVHGTCKECQAKKNAQEPKQDQGKSSNKRVVEMPKASLKN